MAIDKKDAQGNAGGRFSEDNEFGAFGSASSPSRLTPGDGDDFKFAFAENESGSAMKKYAAPALFALLIAGVGGYLLFGANAPHDGGTSALMLSESQTLNNVAPASGAPATDPNAVTPFSPTAPGAVSSPVETAATTTPGVPPGTPTTPTATDPTTGAAAGTISSPVKDVIPAATTAATAPTPPITPSGNPGAVVEVSNVQTPAMPPALTPEVPAKGTGVADMGQSVTQQMQKQAGAAATTATTGTPPTTPANVENFPAVGGPAATPGAVPGAPVASTGTATGTAAAPIKPGSSAMPSGPDTYYDSSAGMDVPSGPLANASTRKINPVEEPASQFVVVKKDEGPQGTDAQIVAANRALKLGHYEAAADMFDTLYAKNNRDPRILMGRAVAYQNSNRDDGALRTYDELLDVDPQNEDALVNMLGLLRKQYPEVAMRRLSDLHEKYPNNAMIAAQMGVTAGDQGQYDDAMRYLGMAVSMQPNNAQHKFNLAVVADRAGKKTDAVKYYEEALEADSVYGGGRSVPREKIYDRLAVLRR